MLSRMKLTDESVGVIVAKCGQGPIKIDDFAQLNEKSVEGIYWVLRRPGRTTGVKSQTGPRFFSTRSKLSVGCRTETTEN